MTMERGPEDVSEDRSENRPTRNKETDSGKFLKRHDSYFKSEERRRTYRREEWGPGRGGRVEG